MITFTMYIDYDYDYIVNVVIIDYIVNVIVIDYIVNVMDYNYIVFGNGYYDYLK